MNRSFFVLLTLLCLGLANVLRAPLFALPLVALFPNALAQNSQSYIYVLRCKGGNYYVGRSTDPDRRFLEHVGDKGSAWTRLHEPLEIVEREIEQPFMEVRKTLEYMQRYGVEKVRGGSWVGVELSQDQRKQIEEHFRNDAFGRKGDGGGGGRLRALRSRLPRRKQLLCSHARPWIRTVVPQ
jgi:predicted GIY-YIG superfamily endonuclease